MTWSSTGDGYDLFFNRDESLARELALPPEVRDRNGLRFIAPIDGKAGGTWMGVNELGISVCLMNGSACRPLEGPFVSRGLVVLSLLDCISQADVLARVDEMELSSYRPFSVFAFQAGGSPGGRHWDGVCLERELSASPPLVSRSFRRQGVHRLRTTQFHGLPDRRSETLEGFHRSHDPERGSRSVCIHRQGFGTVSLSRIQVGADGVSFHYAPGPPCQTPFDPPVVLPRP